MKCRLIIILIILCFLFAIQGCGAHFGSYEFQKYKFDPTYNPKIKPSIDYEVHSLDSSSLKILSKNINELFTQSSYFSKNDPGHGVADYHFSIDYNCYVSESGALIDLLFLLTAFTLPLPAEKDKYILKVNVIKKEIIIKQYSYEYDVDKWNGLIFILYVPFQINNTINYLNVKSIFDHLIIMFLNDLKKDNLLDV